MAAPAVLLGFILHSGASLAFCVLGSVLLAVMARYGKRLLGLHVDVAAERTAHQVGAAMLTLLTFVIALSLTDARANFDRAQTNIRREAQLIRQIESDVQVLAAAGDTEAQSLAQSATVKYIAIVSTRQREAFAAQRYGLDDGATVLLKQLRDLGIRKFSEAAGQRLSADVAQLQQCRQEQLIDAQSETSMLFWSAAALLFFVAVLLFDFGAFGRNGALLATVLALAVGLVVGITVEFENPYEGFVRVQPLEVFFSSGPP
ncbi:MAG: DUF4239 domain-containing protein [Planctomycetes bacterium]|nr:DUF4239 domain-containing protein [Planctomycetota bacterium]